MHTVENVFPLISLDGQFYCSAEKNAFSFLVYNILFIAVNQKPQSSQIQSITEYAVSPKQNYSIPSPALSLMPTASTPASISTNKTNLEVVDQDLNKRILSCLMYVKEQNTQILKFLQSQQHISLAAPFQLPENIPVEFPLKTFNEILVLEDFLKDKNSLASVVSCDLIYFL